MLPNITQGILADTVIESTYSTYTICGNMCESTETKFSEIDYQLRNHQAQAIDAIATHADNLKNDLSTASNNLAEMIG